MKKMLFIGILIILSSIAIAEEENDPEIFGLDVEELLNFGSGLLAISLFIATFVAYRRTKNQRLLFVSMAFLLFSIKELLSSLELIGIEFVWIELLSSFLNFAILLSFFAGILKK